MAFAKKCDRCKRLFEIYNTMSCEEKSNGFMFLNIDEKGDYYSHKTHDLCPICNVELHRFMRMEEDDERSSES